MELKKLQGAITSEDVLGKDVIDSNGVYIGVSDKFYLDPRTMQVLGISVDKGFLRKGFVISTNYITEVAKHAVFLNIGPSTLLKGRLVFGLNGAKIGTVASVELAQDTNAVAAIVVKTGFLGMRRVRVPKEYIKSKDKNIFLNITKSELLQNKNINSSGSRAQMQ
ncbi:MAG TPA: PRC-barrel domain-containing protein [Candidatus Nanoarchaeia archaeon]|nr:PRC-barrel domain-containing protein [Candidatus Nanoarchaeia archaeon]